MLASIWGRLNTTTVQLSPTITWTSDLLNIWPMVGALILAGEQLSVFI
jgi:hypothetical protein